MGMKLKDLMLDLATGDASSNDPYIAEAAGQVNVASAYFEAASQINELAEYDELQVVQEVAAAGLPTDQTGSAALGCTAAKKGLEGLFTVIYQTADKVQKQAGKDMKVLLTIAKKYGVAQPAAGGNFQTGFAEPLAKALLRTDGDRLYKKIYLPGKQFIKGKYAEELAKNYTKGMVALTAAYGFDISKVFKDPVVNKEVGKYAKSHKCESLECVAENLKDGAKQMRFESISKDKHYVSDIKPDDIVDLATYLYIVLNVSTAVSEALKGQSANAKANVGKFFDDCKDEKKIPKGASKIGDGMKEWTANIQQTTDAVTKVFTDSVYSLTESLKKKD